MAGIIDKTPPQSLEAEKSLIGSILLDKDVMLKIGDVITAEDFYKDGHAKIYETMIELYEKNEPIKHIELRDWADVLLLAPLDANTLAKIANGLCDNLLTCVARAWHSDRLLVVAPAMNTVMWQHPATKEHLEKLAGWYNLRIVEPVSKKLACGDQGVGAIAEIADIVDAI